MNNDNLYDPLLPNESVVMPKQAHEFNNDHFVATEFLKIRDKFNIETILELGSCVGGSTKWFSNNFNDIHSVEINEQFLDIAKQRCKGALKEPKFYLGSTVDLLPSVLKQCDCRTIIFIDSHWYDNFPLFDELKLIKQSGLTPCVVVHDCLVPNEPKLGFDSYKGVDISYENMKPYLDDIYGVDGYEYHFNTDATSTLVKRGIIFIYPKLNSLERIYNFRKDNE